MKSSARLRLAVAIAAWTLAGCATLDVYQAEPARSHAAEGPESQAGACTNLFEAIDRAMDASDVRDALATRVSGFPYLRVSRFLASFAGESLAGAAFEAWVARLRRLDDESRSVELANLPRAARQSLLDALPERFRADPLESTRECAKLLQRVDLTDDAGRGRLRAAATVPPDYETWKRVVGVYALTRIAFAKGVRQYEAETVEMFATEQPPIGRRVRYAPFATAAPSAAEVTAILARGAADPLGATEPDGSELAGLLAAYAPEFEVDEADENDRIGALGYGAGRSLRVDTSAPTVYARLAYTRFAGRVLPQLVYSAWFPSRPLESPGDLLGGFLDSLVWRVTLDLDGAPLVFDTMHSCGCYHQFVPTARVAARPQPETLDESLFAPQSLPRLQFSDRVVLRVASRTHYLQRVLVNPAADPTAKRYALAPDDALRSLPTAEGRRSAFGADGIVQGSERGERVYFWPMGIREPGAMRIWGRHATAFVGKRHFDDPDLLEKYFRRAE
jgi:hypothetical protein